MEWIISQLCPNSAPAIPADSRELAGVKLEPIQKILIDWKQGWK